MPQAIFAYHLGMDAEQYAFFRIPKLLITEPYFRRLSTDAKLLYGLMLDRMSLSMRNGWMDDDGHVYMLASHSPNPKASVRTLLGAFARSSRKEHQCSYTSGSLAIKRVLTVSLRSYRVKRPSWNVSSISIWLEKPWTIFPR